MTKSYGAGLPKQLPALENILSRGLAMSGIVCRGAIESAAGDPDAETLHRRVLEWLAQLRLTDHLSSTELQLVEAPLGSLKPDQIIEATWSVEGLSVLAWGLTRYGLPRHDVKVDPYSVTDAVGFLTSDPADIIQSAKLRTSAEFSACRELLYAIHCRLRDFLRSRTPRRMAEWIELSWLNTLEMPADSVIVNNELAIGGKPLSEISDIERVRMCEWIVRERHRAIIWLNGEYPVYWNISPDT